MKTSKIDKGTKNQLTIVVQRSLRGSLMQKHNQIWKTHPIIGNWKVDATLRSFFLRKNLFSLEIKI